MERFLRVKIKKEYAESDREAELWFDVVEDNGDRLFIRVSDQQDIEIVRLPLEPIELVRRYMVKFEKQNNNGK